MLAGVESQCHLRIAPDPLQFPPEPERRREADGSRVTVPETYWRDARNDDSPRRRAIDEGDHDVGVEHFVDVVWPAHRRAAVLHVPLMVTNFANTWAGQRRCGDAVERVSRSPGRDVAICPSPERVRCPLRSYSLLVHHSVRSKCALEPLSRPPNPGLAGSVGSAPGDRAWSAGRHPGERARAELAEPGTAPGFATAGATLAARQRPLPAAASSPVASCRAGCGPCSCHDLQRAACCRPDCSAAAGHGPGRACRHGATHRTGRARGCARLCSERPPTRTRGWRPGHRPGAATAAGCRVAPPVTPATGSGAAAGAAGAL
jgi:hypothetical protein